jgi:uncharacterized membrane protein
MNARAFPARTVILVLSALGALACIGLELIHYRAYAAPASDSFCAIGEKLDCHSVALSRFAVLLGVPLPVWGFAGFVAIFAAAWQRSRWTLPLALVATLAGVVLSAVSVWRVGALCWVCEATHLVSLAILVSAWRGRAAFDAPLAFRDRASREIAALSFLPALGLIVAAHFFLPRYWAVFTWRSELPFAHGTTHDGHPWIGAEHPTLTLDEFVDYSCPHCRVASSRSLARLAEHPNELRIVRRHYPRSLCQLRTERHCLPLRIALCAGDQDRFWQADRWLFDHAQGGQEPDVAEAARDLGLDAERLSSCVKSEAAFDRAVAEWKQAKKLHIPGAPHYLKDERTISAAAASKLIDAL